MKITARAITMALHMTLAVAVTHSAWGATCGDAIVEAPETCDDGNTTAGDGCYSTCQVEQGSAVAGTSVGGTIDVVISGVNVSLQTVAEDRADVVMGLLAAQVNASPALQSAGISAQVIGNRIVTNGSVDSVGIFDTGLTSTSWAEGLGGGTQSRYFLPRRR